MKNEIEKAQEQMEIAERALLKAKANLEAVKAKKPRNIFLPEEGQEFWTINPNHGGVRRDSGWNNGWNDNYRLALGLVESTEERMTLKYNAIKARNAIIFDADYVPNTEKSSLYYYYDMEGQRWRMAAHQTSRVGCIYIADNSEDAKTIFDRNKHHYDAMAAAYDARIVF